MAAWCAALRNTTSRGRFIPLTLVLGLIGGGIYGYNISAQAWLDQLKDDLHISSVDEELISGMSSIGALVIMPASGAMVDKAGRRIAIYVACGLGVIGTAGQLAAYSVLSLLFLRFIAGLSGGIALHAVPTLVSECLPTVWRSAGIMWVQFGVSLGFALPPFIQYVIADWRWCGALGVIPCLLTAVLLLCLKLPDPQAIINADNEIESQLPITPGSHPPTTDSGATRSAHEAAPLMLDGSNRQYGVKQLFTDPALRWPIVIGIALAFANNASDIILFYGTEVLNTAGIQTDNALLLAGALGLVSTAALIPAGIIVQKFRRRPLYLVSCGIVVLTFFGEALAYGPWMSDAASKGVAVFTFVVFMLAYQIGPGPLFLLLVVELHEPHVRGVASSINYAFMNLFAVIITVTLLSIIDAIGICGTFFGYGILFGICWGLIWWKLPDTTQVEVLGRRQESATVSAA